MLTQVDIYAGFLRFAGFRLFTITSMFHLSKLSPSLAVGVSQFKQHIGVARVSDFAEARQVLAAKWV
jgi:hypothetical protein